MTTSKKRARRGAGSARKRCDRWEFRFRIGGGQHSVYGRTLAEARRKAEATRAEWQRGLSPTVGDWLAQWLTLWRGTWRPQTWRAYNLYAQHHIVPAIGGVRLEALTADHIDQLHTTMLRTVSATSTRHAHCVLSALRAAARRGLLVSSAIRDVPPPRRSSPLIGILTRDEVTRLINAAHGDALEGAYVLAVTLGIRQGELRGLRWSAVQLQERRVVVRGNATRTLDNQQVISLPKTRASHRSLRLPEVAVDAMMRTPRRGELV